MVSNNPFLRVLLAAAITVSVFGCNVGKHVPEGQHLLRKNKISIKDTDIPKDEIAQFVKPSPNRRLLGLFPVFLWVYQKADGGSETGFKNWVKRSIGEEPVFFDETLTATSQRQIELFLKEKGYFNSQVETSVRFNQKYANVHFSIIGNEPYYIRNISYVIDDETIKETVLADTLSSLVKTGQRYDASLLQEERDRITRNLRSNGYFSFSNEFVFFEVDSALNSHQVDIFTHIKNPGFRNRDNNSDNPNQRHRKFVIDRVFVFPDVTPFRGAEVFADTTVFVPRKGEEDYEYLFVHEKPMRVSPKTIAGNIPIRSGEPFDATKSDLTYNLLNRLRNFRFINIQFLETSQATDSLGKIDVRVQLAPYQINSFTIEAEGFNTSGNQGLAANLLFANRNLFGGAERFSLRLKGATEMTIFGQRGDDGVKRFFHTFEFGTEATLEIPRLLAPLSLAKIPKTARPTSTIKLGFNYRHRPSYTRYLLNAVQEFEWSQSAKLRHYLSFLDLGSINISMDKDFSDWLESLNNPLLASRYKNLLTVGSRYSLIYNTQIPGQFSDFFFLRGNIELPSPFLFPADWMFGGKNEEGKSTLLGRAYAQFIRTEVDIRYNRLFSERSGLAMRLFTGIGVPFGNSDVLPFVKSFYSGGANSIRAWRIYTLGPGSAEAATDLRFDRFGDIKLEANMEYRFPIYKFFRGALFVDAGNVWFLNENPDFQGGEFKFNRFASEIALGAGIGLRWDFQFFVVRLDAGVPVRDPSMPAGQRWVDDFKSIRNYNFNLGIGYPF